MNGGTSKNGGVPRNGRAPENGRTSANGRGPAHGHVSGSGGRWTRARTAKLGGVLVLGALAAAGCDDDGTDVSPPTEEDVAGAYAAGADVGTFVAEENDETTDLLEAGATVSLTLGEDGGSSGDVLIPEWGENGEDLEVDLAGTWELDGFVVTLELDAASFADGLELTWADGVLTAGGTLEDGVTFDLELELDQG